METRSSYPHTQLDGGRQELEVDGGGLVRLMLEDLGRRGAAERES